MYDTKLRDESIKADIYFGFMRPRWMSAFVVIQFIFDKKP